MANELKHGSVGTELTQTEWEAVGAHVFSSQAAGDIMYASSTSQLTRLGKGADNTVLHLASGIPAWSATLAGLTLTTPTISSTGFANATHAHAASNSGGALTYLGTIATGVWQGTDVGVAYGGTGVSTLTDGGVLLGSGASAITAMAVLTDGQMIVGNGSTDPVAESGATLRTSIGVGTGDSPTFTALTLDGDLGFTGPQTISTSSGDLTIGAATGADVLIGDNATILYVDGGTGTVGLGGAAISGPLLATRSNITSQTAVNFSAFTLTGNAGSDISTLRMGMNIQEATSGTHPVVAGLHLMAPTVTNGGGSEAVTSLATLYITGAPTAGTAPANGPYALFVDAGASRFDGDIGATGSRVPKIWTTDQDTTNAENVSSWSRVKENINAYTEDALAILRKASVVSFSHVTDIDPSGRIKLGLLADSIDEPLAAPMGEYELGYGTGPRIDMMGLAALAVRSIQELADRVESLELEAQLPTN